MAPSSGPAKPDSLAARRAALEALGGILTRKQTMDRALDARPRFRGLGPSDRAFARLLVATALRRKGEIDAVLARCLERPLSPKAAAVGHLLSLGAVQLLILGTPPHAAVDTSVNLAAGVAAGRYKGLVNAVMRRIAREGCEMLTGIDAARADTPDWLWEMLSAAFGAGAARRIAEAHFAEPPLDLTLRSPGDANTWAAKLDAEILPTGGLRRPAGGAIEALPGFDEGAWWVQDAAASLPARLIPEPRGKRVLDLCAAPGGKTLQLAAAGARVTALDQSPERLSLLRENLQRTGLSAETVLADAREFAPDTLFDAVLLDAPCNSTGTIRRHPEIAHIKGPGDAARLAPLQDSLLHAAARSTAPGGLLVYTVCSLDPKEGDARVACFLESHPGFVRLAPDPGLLGGGGEWLTPAGDLRTQPFHLGHLGGMDGFFAARLRRLGEAAT